MAAIFGAIKGIWRAIILIAAVALLPSIAWIVAAFADGTLGMGFTGIFFLVLGLEIIFGVAALFGMASEIQESHSRAVDQVTREQAPK